MSASPRDRYALTSAGRLVSSFPRFLVSSFLRSFAPSFPRSLVPVLLRSLALWPGRSRLACAGEREGHLVGVVAINAARPLGTFRQALPDPSAFDELRARVAAHPATFGGPVGTL
jgi:hypothetical protein